MLANINLVYWIVSATEFQNNFEKYLKLCRHQNVIITRNGKKKAVLAWFPEKADGFEAGEILPVYGMSPGKEEQVTYRQFLEMVEKSDSRYELIDGVASLLTSPNFTHQRILGELYIYFHRFFAVSDTCEDDINVVQPDLLVLCDYMKDLDGKDKYKGTPTLVVELLSPSTRSKDRAKKYNLYMESGMDELWIVDPKLKSIDVASFKEYEIEDSRIFTGGQTAESFRFPGLFKEDDRGV